MDRQLLLFLAVGLLSLGGCAGDPGESGPRGGDGDEGAPCSVTTIEGKATIACPDGSETILEASSCTVESDRGVHTISCPGAEPVVLQDGERIRNGSIAGSAIRFGLPPIAGIEVELVGPSGEQVRPRSTNDEGAFQLTAVPAGLHRVRLQAPGYQPLEIPNVLVLGGAVDLGEQILRRGRLLATGLLEPYLAPNEEWVALLETDPFGGGESFGVTVAGLHDDSVHWLGDEIGEFDFIDDRYVAIMRAWTSVGDLFELSVFDLELGQLIELGPVSSFTSLTGGLLLSVRDGADLSLRFIALPSQEVYELGVGEALDLMYPREANRFAQIVRLTGYFLFDSEDPAQPLLPLAGSASALEPATGLFAFVQAGESADEIHVFDPATGEAAFLGGYEPGSWFHWSPGGAYLAATTSSGIQVFERETGAMTPWAVPVLGGVEFSPSGELLLVSSPGVVTLGDWRTGEGATIPSIYVSFSASERWAASCVYGTVVIVDAEDLSTTSSAHGCDFTYFIDELLFVVNDDEVVRIDPATGIERTFEVYTGYLPSPKGILVDESDGALSIVDMLSGETLPTGFAQSDWSWTEHPDYLLIITGSNDEFHLLDLHDGSSVPIDSHLQGLEIGRSGFAYMGGASPFFLAATSGGGSLFDGFKTYWVPFR